MVIIYPKIIDLFTLSSRLKLGDCFGEADPIMSSLIPSWVGVITGLVGVA